MCRGCTLSVILSYRSIGCTHSKYWMPIYYDTIEDGHGVIIDEQTNKQTNKQTKNICNPQKTGVQRLDIHFITGAYA